MGDLGRDCSNRSYVFIQWYINELTLSKEILHEKFRWKEREMTTNPIILHVYETCNRHRYMLVTSKVSLKNIPQLGGSVAPTGNVMIVIRCIIETFTITIYTEKIIGKNPCS